tara:strand:- start:14973 stop:15971 length:999 start_codon:yes stop_codon:yes gene_type:complete
VTDAVPDVPEVVAGIDEAGLGPMLGPFALGWCALRVSDPKLDLMEALAPAVMAKAKRGDPRMIVADSKEVFDRTPRGWSRLEATALSFLACRQDAAPITTGRQFLEAPTGRLAPDSARLAEHPWFEALPESLPLHLAPDDLHGHTSRLRTALEAADVQVVDGAARLAPAGELNESFRWTDSKGRTVWTYVADVLEHLWERFGDRHVHVHLDRQGGRTYYGELLQESFPMSSVRTKFESKDAAEYQLDVPGRRMTLRVTPRAETESFAVAVASCFAKYGREVSMEAFNDWFGALQPGLKPTAGYVTDARRWLSEAGPALSRADVPMERIVRQR